MPGRYGRLEKPPLQEMSENTAPLPTLFKNERQGRPMDGPYEWCDVCRTPAPSLRGLAAKLTGGVFSGGSQPDGHSLRLAWRRATSLIEGGERAEAAKSGRLSLPLSCFLFHRRAGCNRPANVRHLSGSLSRSKINTAAVGS